MYIATDKELEPEEITRRVLMGSMGGIEDYLSFTTEIGGEFDDGWLPTLDTALRVTPENKIEYKFYEKPEGAKTTIQVRTAMGENVRNQTLSQEMVRRLMNTSEGLPENYYWEITDNYATKLHNSGYTLEQIRKILLAGIKGFESKKERCKKESRPLRRTAEESLGARMKNKLVGKATWFKKKKKKGAENKVDGKGAKQGAPEKRRSQGSTPCTVLFVEQTPRGELAHRLRELLQRLEPTLGFNIKTVERTGATLRSNFPLYELWENKQCGRNDCIPCQQGADFVQPCTKTSVVYENTCLTCNPGADGKRELKELNNKEAPTSYVGETSRSVKERTQEHWGAYRSRNKDSHMLKHQELQHGGAAPPKFVMRIVSGARSALERQTKEAVRIRRRGGEGAILNSKAEFNRCYIPRLQLGELDVEQLEHEEKEELQSISRELDENLEDWEQKKQK